jgi:pre-mRNA-splicing factor CWC22
LPKKTDQEKKKEIKIAESDLIDALKEDPSFLAQKYNEQKQKQKAKEEQKKKEVVAKPQPEIKSRNALDAPSRTGGIYVPPHKLAQLQKDIIQKEEKLGVEHQKLMWELLRKSINGIINKVTKSKNFTLFSFFR